jgi:hypothetical protein
MPRAPNPKSAWRLPSGRVVGYLRDGVYYIDRTIAGRRVRMSTRCSTLAAATAEYERFEINPAAYVSRAGRRPFVSLRRHGPGATLETSIRLRENHHARKYVLAPNDYAAMMLAQGSRCAICATSAAAEAGVLHVDHNHATGQVRGLLCGRCNRGIGQLRDSPELLRRAAEYLERPRGYLAPTPRDGVGHPGAQVGP